MGTAGFIAGLVVLALAAAGVFFYQSQKKGESDAAGLFAPRTRRRLAFVERTSLDGGRKLILVRRDNVEHLILVGGPVDLVVESGIQAKAMAASPLRDEDVRAPEPAPSLWAFESEPELEQSASPKLQPSFFPKIKDEDRGAGHAPMPGIKAAE